MPKESHGAVLAERPMTLLSEVSDYDGKNPMGWCEILSGSQMWQ